MSLIHTLILSFAVTLGHAGVLINHINLEHEYLLQSHSSAECDPSIRPRIEGLAQNKPLLMLSAKLGFEWAAIASEQSEEVGCLVKSAQTILETPRSTKFVLQIESECKASASPSMRETVLLKDKEIIYTSETLKRSQNRKVWVVNPSLPLFQCTWKEH